MQLSPRIVFIALFILGFALCIRGGVGKVASSNDWLNPLAFVGYLLGALALMLFFVVITGHKFPFISGDKQAAILMGGIIVLKIIVGIIYSAVKK